MSYNRIPLDKIRPSSSNPRIDFGEIDELAETMKDEMGIIEPITVRPLPEGDFEVVVGERRARAARKAGWKEIPAIVKDLTDDEVMRMQLVENLHRKDLSPPEEGKLFKLMQVRFGYSGAKIAEMIGKNREYVNQRIRLLDLPKEITTMVAIARPGEDDSRVMSFRKARSLIPLDREKQVILAKKITERGMTGPQLEVAIRKADEVETMIAKVRRPKLREQLQEKYLSRVFEEDVKVKEVEVEIKMALGQPIGPSLKQQWDDIVRDSWALRRKIDPVMKHSWLREWKFGDRNYIQSTIWMDLGAEEARKIEGKLIREDHPSDKFYGFEEADKYAEERGGYCSGIIELRGIKFWCVYVKEKSPTVQA